jgi:hypothetical protein
LGDAAIVHAATFVNPVVRLTHTIERPKSEAVAAGQLDMFEKRTKRLDDFRNMLSGQQDMRWSTMVTPSRIVSVPGVAGREPRQS